jgi:cytochrome P450
VSRAPWQGARAALAERRALRRRPATPTRALFAVTGGSGAWSGMGRELYRSQPAFRECVEGCAHTLRPLLGFDLVDDFAGSAVQVPPAPNYALGRSAANTVDNAAYQDGRRRELIRLGVLQLALCDLWRSAGVVPGATLGISLGELPAAYAAEVFSRRNAAVVLHAIANGVSRRMIEGMMFNVGVGGSEARALCAAAPAELRLLGTLSRERSVLLSTVADGPAVAEFLAGATHVINSGRTLWNYHTPEGVYSVSEMESALADVSPRSSACPVFSAAAGGRLVEARFDAAHWHWMVSRQFFFDTAAAAALSEGLGLVVTIGANPEQAPGIAAAAKHLGTEQTVAVSMRKGERDGETWARALVVARSFQSTDGGAASAPKSHETLQLDEPLTAQDPFPHYEVLRRDGPVHHLPQHGFWLVLGNDEVLSAFSRPQLYSSRLIAPVDPVLLGSDGRPHAEVRRALADAFAAPAVERIAIELQAFAERLLTPLRGGGELDVVRGFASPLAYFTAARLLGLDDKAAARVSSIVGDAEIETVLLFERIGGAVDMLVNQSRLANELRDAHGMDGEQLRTLMPVLWVAATSTTKRVIASSAQLLADDRELQQRLIDDPALIEGFVDESVRLHPPELLIGRVTTEDVTLGGTAIPADSIIQLCIGAANRDPDRFEHPDELRLDRSDGHLAFGSGSHGCPGQPLARVQARIAVAALLAAAPGFSSPQPPCMRRYLAASTTHGLEQLVIAHG